jgi:hypothetical protein
MPAGAMIEGASNLFEEKERKKNAQFINRWCLAS